MKSSDVTHPETTGAVHSVATHCDDGDTLRLPGLGASICMFSSYDQHEQILIPAQLPIKCTTSSLAPRRLAAQAVRMFPPRARYWSLTSLSFCALRGKHARRHARTPLLCPYTCRHARMSVVTPTSCASSHPHNLVVPSAALVFAPVCSDQCNYAP